MKKRSQDHKGDDGEEGRQEQLRRRVLWMSHPFRRDGHSFQSNSLVRRAATGNRHQPPPRNRSACTNRIGPGNPDSVKPGDYERRPVAREKRSAAAGVEAASFTRSRSPADTIIPFIGTFADPQNLGRMGPGQLVFNHAVEHPEPCLLSLVQCHILHRWTFSLSNLRGRYRRAITDTLPIVPAGTYFGQALIPSRCRLGNYNSRTRSDLER